MSRAAASDEVLSRGNIVDRVGLPQQKIFYLGPDAKTEKHE
jgi:hypothetical protein